MSTLVNSNVHSGSCFYRDVHGRDDTWRWLKILDWIFCIHTYLHSMTIGVGCPGIQAHTKGILQTPIGQAHHPGYKIHTIAQFCHSVLHLTNEVQICQ